MATPDELYGRRTLIAAALGRNLFFAVALSGALVLQVSRPLSAALLLAALTGTIAMHVVVGIAGYRRAMRAPWPQVRPVVDDDWD
ncbi:MAG: hypothetical protein KY396_04325 [Actinobacteria bacterium]|nr:hypothetical protein [Actinomycetota bacterium]